MLTSHALSHFHDLAQHSFNRLRLLFSLLILLAATELMAQDMVFRDVDGNTQLDIHANGQKATLYINSTRYNFYRVYSPDVSCDVMSFDYVRGEKARYHTIEIPRTNEDSAAIFNVVKGRRFRLFTAQRTSVNSDLVRREEDDMRRCHAEGPGQVSGQQQVQQEQVRQERARQERARQERERQERERLERERLERERLERERLERERLERERWEREQWEREQREREQREREQWEREQREREQWEREQREREQWERERLERERLERERLERERLERERLERERLEREEWERKQARIKAQRQAVDSSNSDSGMRKGAPEPTQNLRCCGTTLGICVEGRDCRCCP